MWTFCNFQKDSYERAQLGFNWDTVKCDVCEFSNKIYLHNKRHENRIDMQIAPIYCQDFNKQSYIAQNVHSFNCNVASNSHNVT